MTEKCVIPALDAGNYSPKKIVGSSPTMTKNGSGPTMTKVGLCGNDRFIIVLGNFLR